MRALRRSTAGILLAAGFILAVGPSFARRARAAAETDGPPHAHARSGKIELEPHDFGTLMGPQVREHTFRARNPGPEAWTLQRTSNECGCVKAVECSQTVAPGEELELRVRIDTSGQPAGKMMRNVYALLEPGPTLLVAPSRALVLRDPYVVPASLEASVPSASDDFEAVACLRLAHGDAEIAFELRDEPPGTEVALGPQQPSGVEFEAAVEVSGALPPGREDWPFRVELEIRSADGRVDRVELLVHPRRRPHWLVSPRIALLDPEGALPGLLSIRLPDGTAVEDLSFEVDPPGLVSVSRAGPRGLLSLAPTPESKGVERAVLKLRDARVEVTEVPIRFIARAR